MKKISPADITALGAAIGKKCLIEFDVVGFNSEQYEGLITKMEFNDRTGKIRIAIEIDGAGILIPTESIISLEVDD